MAPASGALRAARAPGSPRFQAPPQAAPFAQPRPPTSHSAGGPLIPTARRDPSSDQSSCPALHPVNTPPPDLDTLKPLLSRASLGPRHSSPPASTLLPCPPPPSCPLPTQQQPTALIWPRPSHLSKASSEKGGDLWVGQGAPWHSRPHPRRCGFLQGGWHSMAVSWDLDSGAGHSLGA